MRYTWLGNNIAVPHNIIGPKQKYDDPFRNVASIMINLILMDKQPVIYGDGEQKRCFSDINDVVNPDSIKYNFDNQKALIWNSKSEENGMNILSSLTKKQNDSVYYLKDGKVLDIWDTEISKNISNTFGLEL